jgi:hypothetical protein
MIIFNFDCVRKKRLDNLTFKFCDKVTESKADYSNCFTDVSECYEKSSDKFDPDLKFIECARLFKVKEPNYQPFKYTPTTDEDDLDEQIWREIENLDAADEKIRRKKPNISNTNDLKNDLKILEKIEAEKKLDQVNIEKADSENQNQPK